TTGRRYGKRPPGPAAAPAFPRAAPGRRCAPAHSCCCGWAAGRPRPPVSGTPGQGVLSQSPCDSLASLHDMKMVLQHIFRAQIFRLLQQRLGVLTHRLPEALPEAPQGLDVRDELV